MLTDFIVFLSKNQQNRDKNAIKVSLYTDRAFVIINIVIIIIR